jgi:hypothetical protein
MKMRLFRIVGRQISTALILCLLSVSCSFNHKKEQGRFHNHLDKRTPSSISQQQHRSHSHNKLEKSLPDKDILYKYKGILKFPPARYLARKVIQAGLNIYLKRLPLDKEVRTRFKNSLKSKQYRNVVIPFLMAAKSAYLAAKGKRKKDFKNYIMKKYPDPKEVVGLEHSHFQYDENAVHEDDKGDDKEDVSMTAQIAASVIKMFDIIFLKDSNFELGKMPKRDLTIISKIKDEIRNILIKVRKNTPNDSLEAPVYDNLIKDDYRLEAMSVSAIDYIGMLSFSMYQMFAGRYQYKEKAKLRMLKQLSTGLGEDLWESLNYQLYHKKYGVQVIVDGLQGTAVEALAGGRYQHPFIQGVSYNHKNQEMFKPKNIPTYEAGAQQMDFIHSVAEGKTNIKDSRYLPFFKDLYKNHEKGVVESGISTTPTISVRNLPIIQTGMAVDSKEGGTGLPNFHYLDRKKEQAFYFWGNDAIMLDDLTAKSGMKTLFQRMPDKLTLNCMATYEMGANWSINPAINVALGEKMRDFGEILCITELERRGKMEKKSRRIKKRLLKLGLKIKDRKDQNKKTRKKHIRRAKRLIEKVANLENEIMPDLVTFYSPWLDHFGHFTGPFSDETLSPTGELNRLDFWMGRVVKTFKDANVYDKTLFTLTGDHGLTPTKYLVKAEVAIFDSLVQEGYDIKMLKISSDEGEGPKIRNHLRKEAVRGYDVMVASTGGGNFQIELFVDQDENWARQPIFKEASAIKLQSGQVLDVPTEIVNRLEETLEYGAIREDKSNYNNSVTRLFAKRDGERVDEIIHRKGKKLFYEKSADLLMIDKLSKWRYKPTPKGLIEYQTLHKKCLEDAVLTDDSTWCEELEWRALTSYTDKPDSVVQISHLFDIDYSGTIHLFSQSYIGFNSLVPGRHAGELFHEKDAFMAIWGSPVQLKKRLKTEEVTAPAATLYQYMTGEKVIKGKDGWGDDSMLNK